MVADSDASVGASLLHRRIGGGIAARITVVLAVSTLLYTLAAVFAVTVTRTSVAAGHALPWLKVTTAIAVAAAASLVLLVAAMRSVSLRLTRVRLVLQDIGRGDLTVRVGDGTDDDIGDMGRAVDAAAAHTRDVIVTVHRAMSTLRKGWEEVEEVGAAMAVAAETTCVEALSAATAADQVSNSIHVVAAATEQLGATVRDVAVHASEASTVATAAAEQASLASSTVRELGIASQRVGAITDLITSIAEQTHLLALNATIEAAHAGEMGRGFAVVAGEVKELARETAEATETVSRTVTEIQSGSGRATSAIGEFISTITVVSENQAAIASAVVEQTAATNEISRVSAEAAQGSSTIATNIARVSDSARSTAYAGGQARTTAAELADVEKSLAAAIVAFSIGDVAEVAAAKNDDNALGTTLVDGVMIIQDGVKGTGVYEFDYQGEGWRHSTGNIKTGGTNTYNCTPDAVAVLRFVGTRIRLYGISDPSHGIGAASVDRGQETLVDLYSPERQSGKVSWESRTLPQGEHRFELRVANAKNPQSRYFWIAIDRVEVI